MNNELSAITERFFRKTTFSEVTVSEIEALISTYPYVAPLRFLLAKKEYDAYPSAVHDDVITAGLYFHNPLWFEWQLRRDFEEPAPAPAPPADATQHAAEKKGTDGLIEFQSYHTIDYFASQGIRLQQADLSRDKLGQQLKSFTEWLRSMKKLPAPEVENTQTPDDSIRQEVVMRNAAASIEDKDIVTEAMAEVWTKQGNYPRAIEIYTKLSLLNPSKSAYFASKIDQLKQA